MNAPLRRGFTVAEIAIALTILALALVVVAEVAGWQARERFRSAARQDALEAAANVLEAARATPWDDLTPAWAEAQRLPDTLADRLPEGKLTVRVAPEADRPRLKRVTVTVSAKPFAGMPTPTPVCQLTGLFAPRSGSEKGDKP